jgi:uncharacterized protein
MEKKNYPHEKLKHLREIIRRSGSAVIAFSGGADSTLLLQVAVDELGNGAVAMTARSAIHPQRETDNAVMIARGMGARQVLIETDELSLPEFVRNPKNRCYICKRALFWEIRERAAGLGIKTIFEGSNADDLSDFRPGMRALKELGIQSPLLKAGLTKEEIRFLLKEMGLSVWDRQPFACLATRFPYGEEITLEKLIAIDRFERYLLTLGFKLVRVRRHGDLARIEVGRDEVARFFLENLAEKVNEECKNAGFEYCTIDLNGYRRGSMNEAAVEDLK